MPAHGSSDGDGSWSETSTLVSRSSCSVQQAFDNVTGSLSSSRIRLIDLPAKTLRLVTKNLDPISALCLRRTCRRLLKLVKVDRSQIDSCGKRQFHFRLVRDLDHPYIQRECCICRAQGIIREYWEEDIVSLNVPSNYPKGALMRLVRRFWPPRYTEWRFEQGLLHHRPRCEEPTSFFCYSHLTQMYRPSPVLEVFSPNLRGRVDSPQWSWVKVKRCGHCGEDIALPCCPRNKCHVCTCKFCPVFEDKHYIHVDSTGTMDSVEAKGYWKERGGRLMILEAKDATT